MQENGHLKMVAKICQKEGVPVELVFLALVESGWQSSVASAAGAKGYWQFTESTAIHRGLKVNPEGGIDQRTNARLSTKAAIRYLKFLYKKTYKWEGREVEESCDYDDSARWIFALWAYNRGPKHVGIAYQRFDGNVSEYVANLPERLAGHADYPNRFFGMMAALMETGI